MSIPVAALSKAWVCNSSLAGIVGSNPDGGIVTVSCVLRVRWFLRQADHSSRRILSSVYTYVIECDPAPH
jgi:hypothetical protein